MASKSKKASSEAAAMSVSEVTEPVTAVPAETTAKLFAGYEEFADLNRENIAAVIAANAALREGIGEIGKEVLGYARTSLESAAEAATALLGAKTIEDVFELNATYAKASLERLISRTTKLSEMGVKVANETLA